PPFSVFRVPARHIVLLHLAMSILSAIAFAELTAISQRRERIPWKSLWPLAIPALLSLLTAILAVTAMKLGNTQGPLLLLRSSYSTMHLVEGGTFLILIATALTVLAARGVRWSLAALIILTGIDALAWGMDYVRNTPAQSIEAFTQSFPNPPDSMT